MKTTKNKGLRFFDSLTTAIQILSYLPVYKDMRNKKFSMYQIPRGEILGVVYIPSKSHKGKTLTFIDVEDNELSINLSSEKENALWDIILGVNKKYYSSLSDLEISKVTFWFIMGGGNQGNALCEVDFAEPFMTLLSINWDGKWIYPENYRCKEMDEETLKNINNQRMFYLDQFLPHSKVGSFDLDYPNLAQDEIRQYLLTDKISRIVTGTPSTSAGYAVICIPEAPYFFQRPNEFWFGITHTSTAFNRNGSNSRKTKEPQI